MMNKLRSSSFLAVRFISRGNRTSVVLMICIVTLAFVNLVFISSILSGLLTAIDDEIRSDFVSNIVIEPPREPRAKPYVTRASSVQRQLEALEGVVATASHYQLTGTIAFDRDKKGDFIYQSSQIVGVDPEEEEKISQIPLKIIDGRYLRAPGVGEIILGADLAGGYKPVDDPNSLGGAKVGDRVSIVFGNGGKRAYRIVGVFRTFFAPIDSMAFVTTRDAESILSTYDSASQILVKLDQPGLEDDYVARIRTLLPGLEVRKWSDFIGVVGDLSGSLGIIQAVVSAIGMAVAAITIFMMVLINLRQKRRQLGILKAIGIPPDVIIYAYMWQILLFWCCGMIAGLLLIALVIGPYFSAHPLETPIGKTGLSISSSMMVFNTLSLLAAVLFGGLIPAWRGTRENIIKAIWSS